MYFEISSRGSRETGLKLLTIVIFLSVFLFLVPFSGITEEEERLILGKVYNDTDLAPPRLGPVPINIVIDDYFMGRVEPGESLVIGLKPRRVPYVVKAYIFEYEGSSFFAVVDLPLNSTVMVPVSHRGEISPFWVAFEGIRW
jgi:hypothetical protein